MRLQDCRLLRATNRNYSPWRSREPDRAVNCRFSLRENSRRRPQESPRVNISNPYDCSQLKRPTLSDLGRVPICRLPAHGAPHHGASVAGRRYAMGREGRARPWSPEARPGVGRPMVTGTARRWYHGDLQIYYVHYACASIYCVPRACPPAQNVVVAHV